MDNPVATVALVVLAGVSLLWTVGLLMGWMELRRLLAQMQETLRFLEAEIRPLSAELREAVRRFNQMTQGVEESNARLQDALGAFQQAGQNVRVTTEAVRSVFGSRLIPVAGVMAGLRAGAKLLWKRYRRGGVYHE